MMNGVPALQVVEGSSLHDNQISGTAEPDFSFSVRSELRRILNSRSFDASERNRRFLEYVVEETLAGRGARIKAYNIATIVFGRDQDFDPQLDPVVRMEARRIRRSLERFYFLAGEKSARRITIPKGSYVPEFQFPFRGSCTEKVGSTACLSIFVSTFDLEDVSGTYNQKFGDGFARQLVVRLGRFPEIRIFVASPLLGDITRPASATLVPTVDSVLSGNIVASSEGWHMNVTLVGARDGQLLWADVYESHLTGEEGIREREEIADRIVAGLANRMMLLNRDVGTAMTTRLRREV